jgi:hypothetical protein
LRRIAALILGTVIVAGAVAGRDAPAVTGGTGVSGDPGARLQGTWTMRGRVTRADGVRGERKGQRVVRKWSFVSTCPAGPCATVDLSRERSLHQIDQLVLKRSATRKYAANGRFYVRLRCGGRTYPRGGVAYITIRLTISKWKTVQSTRFATAIGASYSNPRRVNRTPCHGSIGRDAGAYSGTLTTPVPVPPTADFTSSVDPVTSTVSFGNASKPAGGAALKLWQWDFGDPASGADNTSTASDPSHHYGAPGSYTVTLTVTDSNGLTNTITHQVTI